MPDKNNKKNRFKTNSKYFTISVYTVITFLVLCLIVKVIFFWSSALSAFNDLMSTLLPFLIGILIAFLISPLVNWVRNTFLSKWFHIKNNALNNLLAIFLSYAVVLCAFIAAIVYIVPAFIGSLTQLLNQLPAWGNAILSYVNELSERYPDINLDYIQDIIASANTSLQSFLSSLISGMTSAIVSTGVRIVKFIFNLIVAVIVSCYLLIDKKIQSRGIKRLIYAVLPKDTAAWVCNCIRRAITIFSNFFGGKMVDSLIMGILCFICMMILRLFGLDGFGECALLVSVIVGVTNMIPYFGPFLGGVPCAILLSIYSLQSGLAFAILILILQQLDGNIIGPRILGNSTGLRPLWIIFAITIGGWVGGVIGMFLGVPCVAVISGLLGDYVDGKLKEKNIDMPPIQNQKVRTKQKTEKAENSKRAESNKDSSKKNT